MSCSAAGRGSGGLGGLGVPADIRSPPRVMTVPATAIYFTAYDQLKAFLCSRALTSDFYAPMVAGALARCERSPGP